jgi:peptidoglycan/LPS O-acetylase OafA/YrhL
VLYPIQPAVTAGLLGRMLARLGKTSYAFYLWHIPVRICTARLVVCAVARGMPMSMATMLLATAVTLGATVLVALFTTWAIETPFLRLRDRWVPSLLKVPLFAKT